MNFGNLTIDLTWIGAGAGLLAVAGLVTWLLKRRRMHRVWLPTIRIMRLESRVLPRLVFRPPPLLAFLCFLVSAMMMLFFVLRPKTQVFTPFEPNQTRIHVFVDLSPSVSAHKDIDALAREVGTLYGGMRDSGRITLSTSHGPTVIEPKSVDEVVQYITRMGFHRGGVRLGSAQKTLLEQVGETDRLVIVSDRDQHSWTGFSWKFLLDEMDVVFFDITSRGPEALTNGWVNDARYLSSPQSPTLEWEVEVARRTGSGDFEGSLEAMVAGRTLATVPVALKDGRQRGAVRISWPALALDELGKSVSADVPLVFRLKSSAPDLMDMDNEFRTELLGLKRDVLLISEGGGEQMLEDPANQLRIALEILGFRVRRQDYISQPGPKTDDVSFVVILGGSGLGIDRYCPRSLPVARKSLRERQGARSGLSRPMPWVWLAPVTAQANWQEMCRCYARIADPNPATQESPPYCEHVETREHWLALLPSLGAAQIGGDIGQAAGALAFRHREQDTGFDVLAFTVPLMPLRATGITHAAIPVLVRELLKVQGIMARDGGMKVAWPRIEDIADDETNPAETDPLRLAARRTSNIPAGESQLSSMEFADLPPRLVPQTGWSDKQLPARKDREDPLPWIRMMAFTLIGAGMLEALLLLGMRVVRFLSGRSESLLLLAALAGAAGFAPETRAGVDLVTAGFGTSSWTFRTLSREVSGRTSIEINPAVRVMNGSGENALAEPWLFSAGIGAVTGSGGALKPEVAAWLRRGGFLVIEGAVTPAQLAALTTGLDSTLNGASWTPLPPDHELMRSFYLLDALPSCHGAIWRGYIFDGRLAVLSVPYGFLRTLKDQPEAAPCEVAPDYERSLRIFVNMIMVALATDYKRDQIHLPEILKRLR